MPSRERIFESLSASESGAHTSASHEEEDVRDAGDGGCNCASKKERESERERGRMEEKGMAQDAGCRARQDARSTAADHRN